MAGESKVYTFKDFNAVALGNEEPEQVKVIAKPLVLPRLWRKRKEQDDAHRN